MANEMSKDEWALKDRRIVRQSMLKAAVECISDGSVEDILLLAEKFENWVYREDSVKSVPTLPLPTQEQNLILEKFQSKYGIDKETVYKVYGRYPNGVEEAAQALKQIGS